MTDLDPVTLSVLKGRFEQIADEMDTTLFRGAFNPIIAEAHDACHGIYDKSDGSTLVQGKHGLPIFVGTMRFAVKAVIERFQGTFQPGDIFIFNDPYAGGSHLNDFKLVAPYFYNGELQCFYASVGHWVDIGGNIAGGFNALAKESFQEGVCIPPVRLCQRGRFVPGIREIIFSNSRVAKQCQGDLEAQLSAMLSGKKQLDQLFKQYNAETIQRAFQALQASAEKMMKQQIGMLPQRTESFEDFLDNDGIEDKPLKLSVAVTASGENLTLDFSGTSKACKGPLNIAKSTTEAACFVALKHIFPDVPSNYGCLRAIDIKIPNDSLLDAEHPKPVGGYTETILRVIDVVFGAVAKLNPELSYGSPYGTINALSIRGKEKPWVMFSFFGGGLGASSNSDGLNHGNNPISTARIPPLEILEASYPVLFREWKLRQDSAGPGEFRGGYGAVYTLEMLEDSEFSLLGERGKFPAQGIAGGLPATLNSFSFQNNSGDWHHPVLFSKAVGIEIKKGHQIRLATPGGGGFGNPLVRDAKSVQHEVKQGYLTPSTAKEHYGVELNQDLSLNEIATKKLRTNPKKVPDHA